MTPAEARRWVVMELLDHAAIQAEQWHEAASRSPIATPIANEWDRQRETLLRAVLAMTEAENTRASTEGATR